MTVRAAVLLAGVLISAAPVLAAAHRYGPPPAHTGGFGEKTCHECHFDNDVNDSPGHLVVRGLPDTYKPGVSYALEIELTHAELELGGFQAALRAAAGASRGAPAGTLEPAGDGIVTVDTLGVRYLQHTIQATSPSTPRTMRWKLKWKAPDNDVGKVLLNVAANASNGDDSPFGDHIYSVELGSAPLSPPAPGLQAPRGRASRARARPRLRR